MPLLLPNEPGPASMAIGMVRTSNDLSPAFGGADQQIRRKGSRYALAFTMPPMDYVDAMPWMADLGAEGDTVVMEVYQPGLVIPPAGTPAVNGTGQAGALLSIKGLPAGYVIRKGQFFTLIQQGQRYLYRAAQTATANGSGVVSVPLQTMLRRPPTDGDVVEIEVPKIEGFVRNFDDPEVEQDHLVILTFTVRERR